MLYDYCTGTAAFVAHDGQDMQEIFLLESLYARTILLMEVPSGYLADRFGVARLWCALGGCFAAGGR